jgi:hypothetical protein
MIKVGSLVKMKWGYSSVGVVTKVFDNPYGGHIDDVDPPQMASIVWTDIGKSRERVADLKEAIDESR